MKPLAEVKKEFGTNAEVSASIGVEGEDLVIQAAGKFKKPIAEIVEPITKAANDFVDKIEALIPGDQKVLAETAKTELREVIVKAIASLGQKSE